MYSVAVYGDPDSYISGLVESLTGYTARALKESNPDALQKALWDSFAGTRVGCKVTCPLGYGGLARKMVGMDNPIHLGNHAGHLPEDIRACWTTKMFEFWAKTEPIEAVECFRGLAVYSTAYSVARTDPAKLEDDDAR